MKIITGRHADDLVKAKVTTERLNHFFPEVSDAGFGLHPTDLIEKCKTLTGDQVVTVSEIVIRFFRREVRFGRMKADDLEIFYIPDQDGDSKDAFVIGIDDEGEFLQPWPDALFDEDYHLIFDSPEN